MSCSFSWWDTNQIQLPQWMSPWLVLGSCWHEQGEYWCKEMAFNQDCFIVNSASGMTQEVYTTYYSLLLTSVNISTGMVIRHLLLRNCPNDNISLLMRLAALRGKVSLGKQFTGERDVMFQIFSGYLNRYVNIQESHIITKVKKDFRFEPLYRPALIIKRIV